MQHLRKINYKLILAGMLFSLSTSVFGNPDKNDLKRTIDSLITGKDLKAGIFLYDFSTGDTVSINGNDTFPMQSVYKFPIAVALLDAVDRGAFSLSDTIDVRKEDLYPGVWSPLREKYPAGARLPLSEIITYMVARSDNCATDLILDKMTGPEKVQQVIDKKGAGTIRVKNTEREMQSDWSVQFDNYATPQSMVEFLKLFQAGKLLSKPSGDFLWVVMTEITTGRLEKLLPPEVKVTHKTGYSGVGPDNTIAALNDVGIITMPDGHQVAIAVFLTDSRLSTDKNILLIAQIGRAVYDFYR